MARYCVSLHINDKTEILKHVSPDERFAIWQPDDHVPRHPFTTEVEETEPIGKLLDAAIGQFQLDSSGRLNAQLICHLFGDPGSRGPSVHKERNLFLSLHVVVGWQS